MTGKQQAEYVTDYINLVLDKNSQRGSNWKLPLDYTEMMKLVDYITHDKKKSIMDLYIKDPYTGARTSILGGVGGGRKDELSSSELRVKQLKGQVAQLKTNKLGRKSVQGAGGGGEGVAMYRGGGGGGGSHLGKWEEE